MWNEILKGTEMMQMMINLQVFCKPSSLLQQSHLKDQKIPVLLNWVFERHMLQKAL